MEVPHLFEKLVLSYFPQKDRYHTWPRGVGAFSSAVHWEGGGRRRGVSREIEVNLSNMGSALTPGIGKH